MLPGAFTETKINAPPPLDMCGLGFLVMQRHYLILILYHVQFHVLEGV